MRAVVFSQVSRRGNWLVEGGRIDDKDKASHGLCLTKVTYFANVTACSASIRFKALFALQMAERGPSLVEMKFRHLHNNKSNHGAGKALTSLPMY